MVEPCHDPLVVQALMDLVECDTESDAQDIVLLLPSHLQAFLVDHASRMARFRRHMTALLAAVPRKRLIASLGSERVSEFYWRYL